MPDLIDRAALCEKIQPVDFLYGHDEDAPYSGMAVAAADIESAPAVDAVEVVRCKDCKSWTRHSGVAKYSPTGLCSTWADTTLGVDFCSNGERRDNA